MDVILETHELCREFHLGGNTVRAVDHVSLSLPKGKLIIIRGRSGSGKTTLLNLLGGLDIPSSGQVYYLGKNLHSLSEAELTDWRRREVGFIFQSFALLPHMNALENVELPMRFSGMPWKERRVRAEHCLQSVGLLKRARHRALELSGGEQQRVAIARAIANSPRLIIADEPTGELDFETGMRVMELFRQIVEHDGVTVLVSTHDAAASEYGDIHWTIQDGQLVEEGLPA